jgi:RNA polymerase sigma factor (sigma-70 family)
MPMPHVENQKMAKSAPSPILELIRRITLDQRGREVSDHDLLKGFSDQHDEAAFHMLLRRHGPMVLHVCRGVLAGEADAEDAFQATFLILASKAASIRKTSALGSWLHGVAYRTALKARAQAGARRKNESRAPARPISEPDDLTWQEVRQVMHEELTGLADRYRVPLVVCYLEGQTQDAAAVQLGLAKSTLKERLERGRAILRARLVRRGLGPAPLLVAAAWPSATALACLPATLVTSTIKAANLFAAGQATVNGVISAKVAALTEGILKTMFLTNLKVTAAGLVIAALLATGLFVTGMGAIPHRALAQQSTGKQQEKPKDKDGAGAEKDSVRVVKAGKQVNSLTYCNDGTTIAIVLWEKLPEIDVNTSSVVLWDLKKGKVAQTLEKFQEGSFQFRHVTSSKDGTMIAASATDVGKVHGGAVKVWEAKTGKLAAAFELDGQVYGTVALSPDGKKVAGGTAITPNGKVCVWDVQSGQLLKTLTAENMEYFVVALSEDGKWIAAGGRAGADGLNRVNKVFVWELETGKVKHEWTDTTMVGCVAALAFSPDSKHLVAGGPDDATTRVWDMESGKLKYRLNAHSIPDGALAFSPDGKRLATAGRDHKVIVWDVAKEKAQLTLQGGDSEFQVSVAFSADGRTLASGSGDGTMRFWRLPPAGVK